MTRKARAKILDELTHARWMQSWADDYAYWTRRVVLLTQQLTGR